MIAENPGAITSETPRVRCRGTNGVAYRWSACRAAYANLTTSLLIAASASTLMAPNVRPTTEMTWAPTVPDILCAYL